MIFVCVGSREYQFNRLLKQLDGLVEEGEINEEIIAQIGQSTYIPKNYAYNRFVDANEFKELQGKADMIISHGGTGALIGALKQKKQVIAVPRLEKYGEHIDDHQLQVASVLQKEGYLKVVLDMKELISCIKSLKETPVVKFYKKKSNVVSIINNYISNIENNK